MRTAAGLIQEDSVLDRASVCAALAEIKIGTMHPRLPFHPPGYIPMQMIPTLPLSLCSANERNNILFRAGDSRNWRRQLYRSNDGDCRRIEDALVQFRLKAGGASRRARRIETDHAACEQTSTAQSRSDRIRLALWCDNTNKKKSIGEWEVLYPELEFRANVAVKLKGTGAIK